MDPSSLNPLNSINQIPNEQHVSEDVSVTMSHLDGLPHPSSPNIQSRDRSDSVLVLFPNAERLESKAMSGSEAAEMAKVWAKRIGVGVALTVSSPVIFLATLLTAGAPLLFLRERFFEHAFEISKNYNKDEVISKLNEDRVTKGNGSGGDEVFKLFNASLNLRGDKEVVLNAVKVSGKDLADANRTLRGDKDVVNEAVKQNGLALRYASRDLRNDKDVVREAVKQNAFALQYASKSLRNDKQFVLSLIKNDHRALKFAGKKLQNDPEVESVHATALYKQNKDRGFVLKAVKQGGMALKNASTVLKNDSEVVLAAVKNNSSALQYASEKLRNNKEIALIAVKKHHSAYEFVGKNLKNDPDIKHARKWAEILAMFTWSVNL